jgi:hypothetical protein
MASLLITTSGCNVVERRLRAVSRLAADFSPAWDGVELIMVEGIRNAFDKEGPGWAPNDPSTLRSKSGTRILRDTDRLYNSLTSSPKTKRSSNSIDIVTGVPYADAAFGGTKNMPARPLEITEHYKRLMSTYISERLVEEYERS